MKANVILLSLALIVTAVAAQDEATIITTATGQLDVTPDFAIVRVGATFHAPTATEAGSEMAGAMSEIVAALDQLGFEPESLPTVDFGVTPRIEYQTNTVIGYDARLAIDVTIRDLDRTGAILDAVMTAGANQIGSLRYELVGRQMLRDSALTLAVVAARRDAETIARVSSGSVGRLLELTTIPRSFDGGGRFREEARIDAIRVRQAVMPVTPRLVTVSVHVVGTWEFVPN